MAWTIEEGKKKKDQNKKCGKNNKKRIIDDSVYLVLT